MAAVTNVQVIIDAKDNASRVLKGFESNATKAAQNFELDFKGAAIAATGLVAAIAAVGNSAIKLASNAEQNRVSFETMLGSAEAAKKMLSDLAKFTLETPFEMPQVVQGAKSLMAYGIEADKIIPTFKMLGDISAGVGMDKLPQLTLAFGQVKAATRLTGNELRQFTEAGVPLLQALVDNANKAGGSWVTVGGKAKKSAEDISELNFKLSQAKLRLDEANASGKAKTSTLNNLQHQVEIYTQKVADASGETGKATKVWSNAKVTVEEMRKKIEEGTVSFAEVQAALGNLTGEGGKFQDMMLKQTKTFAGLMSNIRDKIGQTLSEIAGVSVATGEIREGSLFAVLKEAAEELYKIIDVITPKIVTFFTYITSNKDALVAIAGALGGLIVLAAGALVSALLPLIPIIAAVVAGGALLALAIKNIIEGFQEGNPWVIALVAALAGLAAIILSVVIPAFVAWGAAAIAAAIPVIVAFAPIFLIVGAIAAAVAALYLAWTNNWGGIREVVQSVADWFTGVAWPAIQSFFMYIYNLVMFFVAIWQLEFAIIKDVVTILFSWFWSWAGPTITAFFNWIKEEINTWVTIWKGRFYEIRAIVTAVVDWFMTYVYPTLVTVFSWIAEKVMWLWEQFKIAFDWIKEKVDSVIGYIRGLIDNFKPKIDIGLNLPNVEEAWNNLKDRARKIGIPGFQTGGVVPGPIGSPALAVVHGGETINPVGRTSEVSGGGSTFNVYVGMYAGTETEKRNIARDLYSALVQVAQSQNKTVSELMGDR